MINYDAPQPSTRRALARSLPACREAMSSIKDGLVSWREKHESGSSSAGPSSSVSKNRLRKQATGPSKSSPTQPTVPALSHDSAGSRSLASEMSRPVKLIAITPTKQSFQSTVGREMWFCSLHAIHHFSMLRTIAVHELVCLQSVSHVLKPG